MNGGAAADNNSLYQHRVVTFGDDRQSLEQGLLAAAYRLYNV